MPRDRSSRTTCAFEYCSRKACAKTATRSSPRSSGWSSSSGAPGIAIYAIGARILGCLDLARAAPERPAARAEEKDADEKENEDEDEDGDEAFARASLRAARASACVAA